ncbi:hypothetical protein AB0M36_30935 [Actinoplanes sp. NPDC051346]|uniref:hypothetical protein n=1 Tax=Actinoplanes sp. NPDC051346 TaxID=3155048 RepID=UPI00343681A4
MRTPHRHASPRRPVSLPAPLTDWLLVTARGVLAASPPVRSLGILADPRRRRPRRAETTQRLWTPADIRGADAGSGLYGWQPAPTARRLPAQPQQALQLLLSGLGALIVTSIVVLTAFFVIAEERRGPAGGSSAAADTIGSRAVDAAPLTRLEIFPGPEIQPGFGTTPYRVSLTHVDTDCALGTTGELGVVLRENGCSQVVRAALVAPYGDYRVTAGVLNLPDAAAAAVVSDDTEALVESGRGSFVALGAASGGVAGTSPVQVGWHPVGHYLVYCVIARPDGGLVTDDDPHAARITEDLVQGYLTDQITSTRRIDP